MFSYVASVASNRIRGYLQTPLPILRCIFFQLNGNTFSRIPFIIQNSSDLRANIVRSNHCFIFSFSQLSVAVFPFSERTESRSRTYTTTTTTTKIHVEKKETRRKLSRERRIPRGGCLAIFLTEKVETTSLNEKPR